MHNDSVAVASFVSTHEKQVELITQLRAEIDRLKAELAAKSEKYAAIEVKSVVVKTDDNLQRLLIWLLHNNLAEETAGFSPTSCDGGIIPNENIVIIKMVGGDSSKGESNGKG
jgi:uncharacterized small protein (DUF1192 family)